MRGLMMEMGIQQDRIAVETEAQTTVQNALYVLKMIQEKMEADQTKARLIIVTSAYHLPYTAWLFRQVAAALKMNIEMETEAATGAGAHEPSNIGWATNMARYNCEDQKMRKELQSYGITVENDFKFESNDIVIKEMLAFCDYKTE